MPLLSYDYPAIWAEEQADGAAFAVVLTQARTTAPENLWKFRVAEFYADDAALIQSVDLAARLQLIKNQRETYM